jgi:hypothetical protein
MKSLRNLFDIYAPLADRVLVFDNAGMEPILVADGEPDGMRIVDAKRFSRIRAQLEGTDLEGN